MQQPFEGHGQSIFRWDDYQSSAAIDKRTNAAKRRNDHRNAVGDGFRGDICEILILRRKGKNVCVCEESAFFFVVYGTCEQHPCSDAGVPRARLKLRAVSWLTLRSRDHKAARKRGRLRERLNQQI